MLGGVRLVFRGLDLRVWYRHGQDGVMRISPGVPPNPKPLTHVRRTSLHPCSVVARLLGRAKPLNPEPLPPPPPLPPPALPLPFTLGLLLGFGPLAVAVRFFGFRVRVFRFMTFGIEVLGGRGGVGGGEGWGGWGCRGGGGWGVGMKGGGGGGGGGGGVFKRV